MSISTSGNVVVADATPENVTYSEVNNTGTMCVYSDRTREIGVPRTLTVSHQNVGSGDERRVRSLVKFTDCKENPSVEGDVVMGSIHLVFDTPQRIFEKADITDLQTQLVNLIGSANFVDKITNQEV